MGVYLNPGARMLQISRNSKIYVDKSMLIASLNAVISSEHRFVCVSRPAASVSRWLPIWCARTTTARSTLRLSSPA